MSLTEIRKRLEEETKEKVALLESEADKEKESILGEAQAKADETTKREEKETADELKRLEMEQDASMELSAREIELVAREEALDSEMAATKKDLVKAIEDNEALYKKIFSNALKGAGQIRPMRDFTIITSKEDAKYVGKSDARIEYRDVGGGLIIQSASKDVKIDATLDEIARSKNDDIKSALLLAMFGDKEKSAQKKTAPSDGKEKKDGKVTPKKK